MKKILSKFFRIATEGNTVDGRVITSEMLTQAAETYNPALYGARIWLEHIRGLLPGGPFDALGDVHAVQAKKVDGKMSLFAQIEPSPALIELNRAGQKIFSSMEIAADFAKSGKAYLTGLGVTDDPASLGTERLAFNAQQSGAFSKGPKVDDGHFYSVAEEITLEFEESDDHASGDRETEASGLLERIKGMFNKQGRAADERFNDIDSATLAVAEHLSGLMDKVAAFNTQVAEIDNLKTSLDDLTTKYQALADLMAKTEDPNHSQRPPASGGSGDTMTDC